jgi:cell division protein FtsZ
MNTVRKFASEHADIAQGIAYDETMGDNIRVTVVATGLGVLKEQAPSNPLPGTVSQEAIATGTFGLRQDGQSASGVHTNGGPAVWRNGPSSELVRALEKNGMDQLDIPTFLRRVAT